MIVIKRRQLPILEKNNHIIKKYHLDETTILINDILRALDDKNNVILIGQVQSGKTKNTIKLVKEAFEKYKYDLVVVFSGNTNDLNDQTYERFSKEFAKVYVSSKLNEIQSVNKKVIIVALKQVDNIKKIKDYIEENQDKYKKILIVDDECDFCGINTAKEDEDNTKIYEGIYKDIYGLCQEGGVIKLTATPFANILSAKNNLEKGNPKIFVLPTNEEYTGTKYFNNLDSFWNTHPNDKNFEDEQFLLDSLCIWIIKTYQLSQKSKTNYQSDFLVNIVNTNKEQEVICDIFCRFVKESLFNVKENLRKLIEKSFIELNANDVCNFYQDKMVRNTNVCVYNQNSDSTPKKTYNIYIGGLLLSRGKTFENLLCELIVIQNFNYDTLLQKCRWFGYRKNRSEFMTLICNEELKQQMLLAEEIIDYLHNRNLGYQLDYNKVYQELKEKEPQFGGTKFSATGKR